MLKIIFPFKYHLHILQLEEYQPLRFLKWFSLNFLSRSSKEKKALVWTFKAKFIYISSLVYVLITTLILTVLLKIPGILLSLLLASQSYIFLFLGLLTLKPYEMLNRERTKKNVLNKIRSLKKNGLKVIGITGSYGKTSVKEFLYAFLRTEKKVLKTPESYNTLFGISKVVDYELDDNYDYFICEMGAYKIGEIRELCEMTEPDHAILTGINEQHLDRFKKIENTIKAKFELFKFSDPKGFVVANACNENILNNYKDYRSSAVLYGPSNSDFYYKDVITTQEGTSFTLVLKGNELHVTTKLLGKANLENILAAATMAYLLGTSPSNISKAISGLTPVPHRQEIKKWSNGLTVIDDAYNSNVTGFKAALDLLSSFSVHTKVIATPGIVELGVRTADVHRELGARCDQVCDLILLVGTNERTQSLADGVKDKTKIKFIGSLEEMSTLISDKENSIVLIENDLPDNY